MARNKYSVRPLRECTEFDPSQLVGYNLSLIKNLSLERNLATVLRADTFVKSSIYQEINLLNLKKDGQTV